MCPGTWAGSISNELGFLIGSTYLWDHHHHTICLHRLHTTRQNSERYRHNTVLYHHNTLHTALRRLYRLLETSHEMCMHPDSRVRSQKLDHLHSQLTPRRHPYIMVSHRRRFKYLSLQHTRPCHQHSHIHGVLLQLCAPHLSLKLQHLLLLHS
jgi:hypothetical protein